MEFRVDDWELQNPLQITMVRPDLVNLKLEIFFRIVFLNINKHCIPKELKNQHFKFYF